jgi:hypothetical protein
MDSFNVSLPKEGVFWGRLPGFPYWPVRFCSIPEARRIEGYKNKSTTKVPVYFLASCDLAWVNPTSIEAFNAESVAKRLDKQKFKVTKPYRFAFVEALRISMAAGEAFSEDILELARTTDNDGDCAASLAREDVCSKCRGSELGGDALLCDNCNVSETHLHCLRPQISEAPEGGDWFCETCCVLKGLPRGYMPPARTAVPVPVPAETNAPPSPSPVPAPTPAPAASARKAPSLGQSSASTPVHQRDTPSSSTSHKRKKGGRAETTSASSSGSSSSCAHRTDGGVSVLESLQKLMAVNPPAAVDASEAEPAAPATPAGSAGGRGRGADGVLGRSSGSGSVYNGTVRPCSGYAFPDTCMVCDLPGDLGLHLCDYPGCRRSYHQVSNALALLLSDSAIFVLFFIYF